jgi:hypothetical protein
MMRLCHGLVLKPRKPPSEAEKSQTHRNWQAGRLRVDMELSTLL